MSSQDSHLAGVFPRPPLLAYKKQPSLKDILVRAKLPPQNMQSKRKLKGMKKCYRNCHACPYINERNTVSINNFKWKINNHVNCETRNIIYLIECDKENCKQRYIGETDRELKVRIAEHKGYIRNKNLGQPTGIHFNLPGHSLSNMNVTIIEKMRKTDRLYRREKEKYHIKKFNTFYNGMNKTT